MSALDNCICHGPCSSPLTVTMQLTRMLMGNHIAHRPYLSACLHSHELSMFFEYYFFQRADLIRL